MQRFLFIYFYRRSPCFRRFLRTSSGAQNCTHSFRYCRPILLLSATMDEMEFQFHLIHGSSKQQYWLTIPEAVCTVVCSWWWVEEPPDTCRASVELNKQEMLHLLGNNLEIYLRCTDIRMSNWRTFTRFPQIDVLCSIMHYLIKWIKYCIRCLLTTVPVN